MLSKWNEQMWIRKMSSNNSVIYNLSLNIYGRFECFCATRNWQIAGRRLDVTWSLCFSCCRCRPHSHPFLWCSHGRSTFVQWRQAFSCSSWLWGRNIGSRAVFNVCLFSNSSANTCSLYLTDCIFSVELTLLWARHSPLSPSCNVSVVRCGWFIFFPLLYLIYRPMARTVVSSTSL